MSVLLRLSRLPRSYGYVLRNGPRNQVQKISTSVRKPSTSRTIIKASLLGISIGVPVGLGIVTGCTWYFEREAAKSDALMGKQLEVVTLKEMPQVPISRKIISPVDTTGLKLTLFQYQTCPFCCKVRVFLDYCGLSYDVVEVDPVLRREISWSPYRKVPILLAKTENGYQPLNDSTMIISLLFSHLQDKSQKIESLIEQYPNIATFDDDKKLKHEIMNKYFLMFNKPLPVHTSINDITEERKWRKWADDVLVHTLSPNVYRSLDEAYETFNWFSEVGKWDEYFPAWERLLIVNVGALAMWMIAKRLKKRHNLKGDVRQSLYDEVNYWLSNVRARGGTFMGGEKPNLSDLAVYGVLKSIEGCTAFKDVLSNTKLRVWYNAMSKEIDVHSGSQLLNS